jgi:hypothetical protein
MAALIIDTIGRLAWPLTILVVIWMLRTEIRKAFTRLESAKFPGGAELKLFPYEKPKDEQQMTEEVEEIVESESISVERQKIGNVYWLGHDLMWTVYVILRNGPADDVVHGFRQSIHHLTELGLGNTVFGERLNRLFDTCKRTLQSEWTTEMRNAVAIDVIKLRDQLGALMESQQKGYKPF